MEGRGLSKHYTLQLDPKLVHVICEIWRIPCACISCINMLYNLWAYDVDPKKQPHYQPIGGCTYWPLLGTINKWNIIHFTNKNTSIDDFDEVHNIVLGGISENMVSLGKLGKCGAINAEYTTAMGYYVGKY